MGSFTPGLGHIAKNLGSDAVILSRPRATEPASDAPNRSLTTREHAINDVSIEIKVAIAAGACGMDLFYPIPDWTVPHNPAGDLPHARKVEQQITLLDLLHTVADWHSGEPEVRVHLAALLASPQAAALRLAMSHAWARRNAEDIAEARGLIMPAAPADHQF